MNVNDASEHTPP